MVKWYFTLILALIIKLSRSLDNGLALTPPMGWMSGQRFECNTDCVNYPDDCLSEKLVKSHIDVLVNEGYRKLGYTYLVIGDCWSSRTRDSQGHLQADPQRFPSGIKALADYAHERSLKLGLFLELGNQTVHGYPGSKDHLQTDARTLAAWDVDMVTMDAFSVIDLQSLDNLFPTFGKYLNETGRPILFDCRWPMYQINHGPEPNWSLISKTCNIFKVYSDMEDSWVDLLKLVKYYGDNSKQIGNHTGPGVWNNVNQLTIGGYGLSFQQQRMELALWSVLAGPMFVSADLRNIRQDYKELLLNPLAINISQDPLARMGFQKEILHSNGQVRIWLRPVLPQGSYAMVLSYENISGGPAKVTFKMQDEGFHTAAAYDFIDVFTQKSMGIYKCWYYYNGEVNPTGVQFIYAKALP